MADIIRELRHEHRNFQQLIGLMHFRFDQFRNQITSDCEWLLDAAVLIKRYHNAVHQPVEDLFLERLLAETGRARDLLKPFLHADHLIFTDHSGVFIDALKSAINGTVVSRDALVTLGERAMRDLNRQIALEERAVFPFARLLNRNDWREIAREIETVRNTNLENQLRQEYVSLRKRAGFSVH